MPYTRRIVHYSADLGTEIGELSARGVQGCWFELHRLGGCGAGELVLKDEFAIRSQVRVGEWIAFDYDAEHRWYLGRVQSRIAQSPARVRIRLEGMSAELGEIYPGGFGPDVADGIRPHRFSRTDLYPGDPDYFMETWDSVAYPGEMVKLLMQMYVVPRSHIIYNADLVEEASPPAMLMSAKFRGEESVRSILKDQALRSRNAVWGVGPDRTFFFQQQRTAVLATYRIGREILQLEESSDLDNLVNRVLLTGDYIYDDDSDSEEFRFYRWRGHYVQPESRVRYGDKRMRMWVPWIRNQADAFDFLHEFFKVYAEPTPRYVVQVVGGAEMPWPWTGLIRLEQRNGDELVTTICETVRVDFNEVPRLRFLLGPGDPREQWPEPAQDERWEVAGPARRSGWGGQPIHLPQSSSDSEDPPPPSDSESSTGTWSITDSTETETGATGSEESAGSDAHDSTAESTAGSLDHSGSGDESDSEGEDSGSQVLSESGEFTSLSERVSSEVSRESQSESASWSAIESGDLSSFETETRSESDDSENTTASSSFSNDTPSHLSSETSGLESSSCAGSDSTELTAGSSSTDLSGESSESDESSNELDASDSSSAFSSETDGSSSGGSADSESSSAASDLSSSQSSSELSTESSESAVSSSESQPESSSGISSSESTALSSVTDSEGSSENEGLSSGGGDPPWLSVSSTDSDDTGWSSVSSSESESPDSSSASESAWSSSSREWDPPGQSGNSGWNSSGSSPPLYSSSGNQGAASSGP